MGEAVETSGSEISKLIQDELKQEREVKNSLESRAHNVIVSSGTLVTLLFALAALVTKPTDYQLPMATRILIGSALIAFLVAATLAVVVIRPIAYSGIDSESLQELTEDRAWGAPLSLGGPKIAAALVEVIRRARKANSLKSKLLVGAVTAEVIAILALGAAVGVILLKS